jgi:hypothetical protein
LLFGGSKNAAQPSSQSARGRVAQLEGSDVNAPSGQTARNSTAEVRVGSARKGRRKRSEIKTP